MPAAVVGAVAVEAHERHDGDAGARVGSRAAASAFVPSFGRLLATIARTPLRCIRPSTSAIG
jgi:hypothetical protein